MRLVNQKKIKILSVRAKIFESFFFLYIAKEWDKLSEEFQNTVSVSELIKNNSKLFKTRQKLGSFNILY